MMWAHDQITLTVINKVSEGDIALLQSTYDDGSIDVLAEWTMEGQAVIAKGLHVQSDFAMGDIGPHNFRRLVDVFLEQVDLDELIIETALRTTGANRGIRPRRIKLRRRDRPASQR